MKILDLPYRVRHLADLLGLKDWEIVLLDKRPKGVEPPALGAVSTTKGRRQAMLWINKHYKSLYELNATTIHELIHIHQAMLNHFTIETIEPLVSTRVFNIFVAEYALQQEYMTDTLACAVAKLLPDEVHREILT